MNRREFLRQTGATAGCAAFLGGWARAAASAAFPSGDNIALVGDPSDPVVAARPAQWALGWLQEALTGRGFTVHRCAGIGEAGPEEFCVVAAGRAAAPAREAGVVVPTEPESLMIAPGRLGARELLWVLGSDARGLMYALTELADAVGPGGDPAAALRPAQPVTGRPANRVRSVMRLFASDVEDKAWFNDRQFWSRYFALLAAQRFNRFNLALGLGYDQPVGLRDTYFYFAYPFLVSVPGCNVQATNLPDRERDANLAMLRWISSEAAAHGLDFQLGLWTHAYQWTDSPEANHVIVGLTPATHAPYCRDALARVLAECPDITGVTMRIHGESGVPEGSYSLWRTIFTGCARDGRPLPLDLHAKGMDQPTLDAALATGAPLTISPKFWAEHMGLPYHQAAIRPTELPTGRPGRGPFRQSEGARSFLRYGYGDLLREDRRYDLVYRLWPGTQRMLLWGDPVFAAAYGRAAGLCGSAGCEVFDPLSFKGRKGSGRPGGRDGYLDAMLRAPGDDFAKFRMGYRLWGRLLYDPEAPPAIWERQLRADYGPVAAPAAGAALAYASRILPLVTTAHCPSAANNNYWPEMYINMAMADTRAPVAPYTDTPAPTRFGTVSPLDPQLFSRIEDFADELLAGRVGGKYSPVEVAQWLEDLARTADEALVRAEAQAVDPHAPAFRRFAIDTRALIGLGRFFAGKFRAAVLLALAKRAGDPAALAAAIRTYRGARDEWARVARLTTGVYVTDVTYGEAWFQRGHWADRLAAIDRDIVAMTLESAAPPAAALAPETLAALLGAVTGRPHRPEVTVTHIPPASFSPGQAVDLALRVAEGSAQCRVQLHYRHMNQAEAWCTTAMPRVGSDFQGGIPADYPDAVYPLAYYFEINLMPEGSALYPGLGADLARRPYFILRPA